MLQRITSFLVVLMLIISVPVFSQKSTANPSLNVLGLHRFGSSFLTQQYQLSPLKPLPVNNFNGMLQKNKLTLLVPGSYYTDHLGFFCQQELQLEKMITVPVKFRLGSLQYVNYLEQKPNAIKPFF